MISTGDQEFLFPSRPRQPPSKALDTNWTLGAEDETKTLYEQHNPDYIPPEQGGPAVLVADSENNRVVEYQRENGEWNRMWTWSDGRAQWTVMPTVCQMGIH